jgi:hypothetical protein
MKPFRKFTILLLISSLLFSSFAQTAPTGGGGGTPGGGGGGLTGLLGTLNSVLGNLGSIQAAWGALEGLFSGDFSFTKLLDAACKAATAAEGVATSEGSTDAGYGDAKKGFCGLSNFVADIETKGNDIEGILESFSKNVFGSAIQTASVLGANVTPEQAAEWQTTLNSILSGESKDIPARMQAFAENIANTERNNNRTAPNSTAAGVTNDIATLAPGLQYTLDRDYIFQAVNYRSLGQSITNSIMAAEIAKRLSKDTTLMDYYKLTEQAVAPDIRKEARTSVSTRATVQEVVNAITRYMEQDAHNTAFLSDQLTAQVQQQATTNHQLHLMTQSMIEKDIRESQEKMGAIQKQLFETKAQLEGLTNQLTAVMCSFVNLGLPTETNILIANGDEAPSDITISTNVPLEYALNGLVTSPCNAANRNNTGTGTP